MVKGNMEEERPATVSLLPKNLHGSTLKFTNIEEGPGYGDPHITLPLACNVVVAACGAFTFGLVIAYSAPTESGIIADLGLTLQEYSVFGSILTIGGLLGAIVSGKITDIFGRKYTTWILVTIYSAGWLLIGVAKNAWSLDIGRLILGFAAACGSYLVPVYLAEVTPKNLRGGLMSVVMLMTACGISTVFVIGNLISWRTLALLATIPCLLQFFVMFFIPESPRWLAMVGREKDFEANLMRLRGKNAYIAKEAAEIKESVNTYEGISKGRISDLLKQENAYPLTVGLGLMLLQQFGGLNGYTFYTDAIFISAGIPSGVGFITVAVIQILLNIVGVIVIDKFGRRPLLLVSVVGTFIGSFLTGLSFYMQGIHWWKEFTPILALTSVVVYMGSYGLGMGGLPWIIISEILPINVKGLAGSICNIAANICSWIVSYTFNFLLAWSSAGTFFTFAIVNGLGIIFVAKLMPETKGRTLEEIQASFIVQRTS